MHDEMECFMIRGMITNQETSEDHEVEHFLFPNDARLSAIVRVVKVESYVYENDSMEISADCQALSSYGSVFKLAMMFFPETVEQKDKILRDLEVGRVLFSEGGYSVLLDEAAITIYDADYRPLEEELAGFTAEAFRVNSGESKG